MNVPYPHITGSAEEQLAQIKSFLRQLVDQLNYELPGEIREIAKKEKEESV